MADSIEVTSDEARLVALYRAVTRFDHAVVPSYDVSTLAAYLPVLADTQELERSLSPDQMQRFLDGYITGFAAGRCVAAGVSPEDLQEDEQPAKSQNATGIDATTGDIR